MNDLDVDVAEKVMGWTLYNHQSEDGFDASAKEHYEEAMSNDGWSWKGRDGHDEAWMFRPSEEMESAMEVVDKVINLIPDTCTFDIHAIFPGSGDSPEWWAGFDGLWDKETVLGRGNGDSVTEAICRAALDFIEKQSAKK